jgi:hypothetical protein
LFKLKLQFSFSFSRRFQLGSLGSKFGLLFLGFFFGSLLPGLFFLLLHLTSLDLFFECPQSGLGCFSLLFKVVFLCFGSNPNNWLALP